MDDVIGIYPQSLDTVDEESGRSQTSLLDFMQ